MKHLLSGILNNCGLNGALPTIIHTIQSLSEQTLQQKDITGFPYLSTLNALKDKFCEAHDLPSLTWPQFNALLQPYQSNFLLMQLVFAKPLRLFFTAITPSPSMRRNTAQQLNYKTIQEAGRYIPLASDHLTKFYHAFGIPIRVEEHQAAEQILVMEYPLEQPSSCPMLDLICKHDHFESIFETLDEEDLAKQERKANRRDIATHMPTLDFDALGHTKSSTETQLDAISTTIHTSYALLLSEPSPPTSAPSPSDANAAPAANRPELPLPDDNPTASAADAAPPSPPAEEKSSSAMEPYLQALKLKQQKYTLLSQTPNLNNLLHKRSEAILQAIQLIIAFVKKETIQLDTEHRIPTQNDCEKAIVTLKQHQRFTSKIGDFFKERLDDIGDIIQWLKALLNLTAAPAATPHPNPRHKSTTAVAHRLFKQCKEAPPSQGPGPNAS